MALEQGIRAWEDQRHQGEGASVKELIYNRHLLPVAERFASKPGGVEGAYGATYGEHVDRVLRLADGLAGELGVGRGDPFAVMALNGHHYLELFHAGFLGAGVINPLNLRLAPKELAFILGDSETKVCFVDVHFAPLIDAVRKEVGIEKVVLLGEGDVPHDLNHVAVRWGLNEHFVYLHQTPMFHAASMGGTLGIPACGGASTFVPMFEPKSVLDAVEEHRVTMTVMVPTMIGMLLSHP